MWLQIYIINLLINLLSDPFSSTKPITQKSQYPEKHWTLVKTCPLSIDRWVSITYRNIQKFIKIGSNCFPLVGCIRKNLGTSWFPFLHLNHLSFPYLPIQPLTNILVIFIPALIKCHVNKKKKKRDKCWTDWSQSTWILPIRNSMWITTNTLLAKCWKWNAMLDWAVNVTPDIFLLQNTQVKFNHVHHEEGWSKVRFVSQAINDLPLNLCTWQVLILGI